MDDVAKPLMVLDDSGKAALINALVFVERSRARLNAPNIRDVPTVVMSDLAKASAALRNALDAPEPDEPDTTTGDPHPWESDAPVVRQ